MIEIMAVVETAIYVDDLDAAEAFYRDVLSLEVIGKESGRHVFFRVGDGVLLAFSPGATLRGDKLPPHGATGPGHFALGVRAEHLDDWRSRLRGTGLAVEKEVTWPRGGRSLYFRDSAGNSAELVTPPWWREATSNIGGCRSHRGRHTTLEVVGRPTPASNATSRIGPGVSPDSRIATPPCH